VSKQNIQNFSDFSTPVVHLELQIFPRIFKKAQMGYSGAWAKVVIKKPDVKNFVALSL
jgi:hypothetical protein